MSTGSGAQALFREAEGQFPFAPDDLRSEVARDIEEFGRYDFQGIDEVVAIEPWGRSGSVLLASYFDGHDRVMALPALRSNGIYIFFESHPTLSLHQKLIAYPLYNQSHDAQSSAAGCGECFFDGPFAIDRRRYLSAVLAIGAVYDTLPPEFSGSGKGFFIAVHAVFDRALGRRPGKPTPLIVCAQHERDNPTAIHLVEDFSSPRFLHTVRDPITSVDRLFDWSFDPRLLPERQPTAAERAESAASSARYISILAPWMVIRLLIAAGQPRPGEDGRTRVVRFEDIHGRTEDTMRDLAQWLGLEFVPSLTQSTFAGRPYVVSRDGKAWSGARTEKPKRESRNLSRKDRALVYALFQENFAAWGYPFPRAFAYRPVRLGAVLLSALLPTRMEFIVAKAAWRRRVWPGIKRGQWRTPADAAARVAFNRAAIASLSIREIARRLVHRNRPIEVVGVKETPFGEAAV
jgi:hypothetical protein